MKKNSTAVIALIVVVAIILVLLISSSSNKQANLNNNSVTPTTNQNTSANPSVSFSSSPLSRSAYLISTPTYDQNTQVALSGFNVTKNTLADGSTQIALNSKNSDYQPQTYTVKSGQKLYFIETTLGDDGNNNEGNLGDDAAVLVDANGFIIG